MSAQPVLRQTLALAIALAVLVIAGASSAEARSRHERVKVEPLKENGKVVGLKLKLTLRPVDSYHTRVRVGLGPAGGVSPNRSVSWREYAAGTKKGHLLHQWTEIKGLKTGQPKELTLEVKYKDAPNLKPGDSIEVITAWNGRSAGYWHIWGMKSSMAGRVDKFKLPGTARSVSTAATPKPKKPTGRSTAATPKPKKPTGRSTAATPKPKKPTTAQTRSTSTRSNLQRSRSNSSTTRASTRSRSTSSRSTARTRTRATSSRVRSP